MSAPSRARSSAQLRLRSGAARLFWPAGEATAVMVLLSDDDAQELCRSLAEALAVVTLTVPAADGATALAWVADHAGQLAADGAGVLLAGVDGAAAAAAALAVRARDDGWPRLARQILIHPRLADPPRARLAGVAPAAVVGGDSGARGYVAALRRAGVVVRELDDVGELAGRAPGRWPDGRA